MSKHEDKLYWRDLLAFPKKTQSLKASTSFKNLVKMQTWHYNYLNVINSVLNNYKQIFTEKEYKEFSEYFNKWLIDALILTGKCYELPYKLGRFVVLKSKSTRPVPDWNHYHKTGELKALNNEHTDGYKCTIYHLSPSNISDEILIKKDISIRYNQSRYSARRTAALLKQNPKLLYKYQEYQDHKNEISFKKVPIKGRITKIRKDYIVT